MKTKNTIVQAGFFKAYSGPDSGP